MKFYQTKAKKLEGTDFHEVRKKAFYIYKQITNKSGEILHRFAGSTKEKELFFVQIKEDKKTGQKYLISIFPAG